MLRDLTYGSGWWSVFRAQCRTIVARTLMISAVALSISVELGSVAQAQSVIRVTTDYGGSLDERAAQIAQIRASGQRVEIRGGTCYSSCTMYLALPTTCVSRDAILGFHGPSFEADSGLLMLDREFEQYSQMMASYYPPVIRNWFLLTARYATDKPYMVSGAELIRLGVPECT